MEILLERIQVSLHILLQRIIRSYLFRIVLLEKRKLIKLQQLGLFWVK